MLLLFSSADRQSEIVDRKLESWTCGNVEDWRLFLFLCYKICSLFLKCFKHVYDSFVCSPKCDALSEVLHVFDKILIF